jgi:hypothetical protein
MDRWKVLKGLKGVSYRFVKSCTNLLCLDLREGLRQVHDAPFQGGQVLRLCDLVSVPLLPQHQNERHGFRLYNATAGGAGKSPVRRRKMATGESTGNQCGRPACRWNRELGMGHVVLKRVFDCARGEWPTEGKSGVRAVYWVKNYSGCFVASM